VNLLLLTGGFLHLGPESSGYVAPVAASAARTPRVTMRRPRGSGVLLCPVLPRQAEPCGCGAGAPLRGDEPYRTLIGKPKSLAPSDVEAEIQLDPSPSSK
jgi:hypothetical protein